MNLSVIIPVYNQWRLTEACLVSLAEHTPFPVEVIVVDNASSDETPSACPATGKNLFGDRFIYRRFETNRNFAGGCNAGALAASGTLLFFLNNDTLLTENWLPPLVRALDEPPYPVAAGPLLLYPEFLGKKDRVQHLGMAFDPNLVAQHVYEGFPTNHPVCAKPRFCRILTGAALLVAKKTFMGAGMFDEEFINGGEDVDLCLRLVSEGGLMACIPQSRIYHLVSQSYGRHARDEHNEKLLKKKALSRIVPDMHLFAKRDGYRIALTPGLRPYIELPERRGILMARQAERLDSVDALEDFLEKEPLCHEAYFKLAALYQESGNRTAAAQQLALSLHFRPHPATAKLLLDSTGGIVPEAYAGKILYSQVHQDFAEVEDMALFLAKYMQNAGIPELAELYSHWLENSEAHRRCISELVPCNALFYASGGQGSALDPVGG